MALETMTFANHEDLIAKNDILIIDFWAEWCGPCRRFAPIFEQAAQNHPDVTFAKVDTEEEQELAAKYQITSIPMIVAYRGGIPVFGQPGALREADLDSLITQLKALDMEKVRADYEKAMNQQG